MVNFDLATVEPTLDFVIQNHGTIWTFRPVTLAAQDWWSDNVQNGPQLGRAYAVEQGLVEALLHGISEEGFRI